MKVPFGRANADDMKSIALEVNAVELPSLVLFHKLRPLYYKVLYSFKSLLCKHV